MNEQATIQRAIEEYQPPWLPKPGGLKGIVVVVDPAGGGARSIEQRRLDDVTLLTGSYLYHLIRHAGGVPLMTRADDRPAPEVGADGEASLQRVCGQHGADLAVAIEFADSGDGNVSSLVDGRLSRLLARCLAEATGVEIPGEERLVNESAPPLSAPAARVCLSGLGPSASRHDWRVHHRGCAERIYRGVAAFVLAERGELEAARGRRGSAHEAKSARAVPYLPDLSWDEELVQAARRVWPVGNLPIERAAWFCDMYVRTALSDRSMVYLEPQISVDGDTVVIGGATNIAIMRETLADALRAVGIDNVRNELRVLPEEGHLGDQRYGVCIAPMALTFAEPSEAGGLRSQLLCGEPVLLLDRDRGYYLLHGGDGYAGWVHEDCVRVVSADEFKQYTAARQAILLRDIETNDRRIVQGATLPIASATSDQLTLTLPEGGTFDVSTADVCVEDNSRVVAERISRALALLYRPYVFGAVSPIGLDCSGLMRNVCAQTGLFMARDAAQQFLHGRLVATRWHRDGIRPGDLLYFISKSGKIFHVGIALSRTHFVHSAPPEVQISSLSKGDRLYSEYRAETFFAAKRVP
jgi:cell wall-associated NlpC family hydrolase